jgi:hypothetical protein
MRYLHGVDGAESRNRVSDLDRQPSRDIALGGRRLVRRARRLVGARVARRTRPVLARGDACGSLAGVLGSRGAVEGAVWVANGAGVGIAGGGVVTVEM